jgi:hypothetical protein
VTGDSRDRFLLRDGQSLAGFERGHRFGRQTETLSSKVKNGATVFIGVESSVYQERQALEKTGLGVPADMAAAAADASFERPSFG